MDLHFQHTNADNPLLLELVKELDHYFKDRYGDLTLKYQKYHDLEALDCRMLAFDGDEGIGCGGWRRLGEDTAEIKRVFVRLESRRQGVAWTLVRVLENDAVRHGCTRAVLEAGAEEYGALAFYQSCGYRFCTGFGDFAGDENCACMEKELG